MINEDYSSSIIIHYNHLDINFIHKHCSVHKNSTKFYEIPITTGGGALSSNYRSPAHNYYIDLTRPAAVLL